MERTAAEQERHCWNPGCFVTQRKEVNATWTQRQIRILEETDKTNSGTPCECGHGFVFVFFFPWGSTWFACVGFDSSIQNIDFTIQRYISLTVCFLQSKGCILTLVVLNCDVKTSHFKKVKRFKCLSCSKKGYKIPVHYRASLLSACWQRCQPQSTNAGSCHFVP